MKKMSTIYLSRRQKLLNRLEGDAVVIVATSLEKTRSNDVNYPFRPHSNFWYLTGFDEPQALIVFSKNNSSIFLRKSDKKIQMWDGSQLGVLKAAKALQVDNAFAIDKLTDELPKMLKSKQAIYFDFDKSLPRDNKLNEILVKQKYKPLKPHLNEMRLIKDKNELKLIQSAVDISIKAHKLAIKQIKDGLFEYEIQSIFDGFFTKNNAVHAYTPICAGGKNACTLHYIKNNKVLKNNDLFLVDAGCEFKYYASDITRTFPVNGRFSEAQKQIYQLVLDAQNAAIKSIKPGVMVDKPHQVAKDIIEKGLFSLGVLDDEKNLKNFFKHNTNHWLGLDVHDVGKYKINKRYRIFEPGMVITVEPGIYISKNDKIDQKYWDIGIRIEDDVVVTIDGNKVLSQNLAKEIKDIEGLMIKG